jgi:hypothetical protein
VILEISYFTLLLIYENAICSKSCLLSVGNALFCCSDQFFWLVGLKFNPTHTKKKKEKARVTSPLGSGFKSQLPQNADGFGDAQENFFYTC